MLFAGGVPARLMAVPAAAALPALAAVAWKAPYRWVRIVAFLYPDRDPLGVNFQLKQSFIAFGSGGLWGVGLGESQQKMFYLPEAHTDFLFSVIGGDQRRCSVARACNVQATSEAERESAQAGRRGLGASEARKARSGPARRRQTAGEAERESARVGRRGLGASEARKARSGPARRR